MPRPQAATRTATLTRGRVTIGNFLRLEPLLRRLFDPDGGDEGRTGQLAGIPGMVGLELRVAHLRPRRARREEDSQESCCHPPRSPHESLLLQPVTLHATNTPQESWL